MYYVDGIPVNDKSQADVLADRLFNRYNKAKTVLILDDNRMQVGIRIATRTLDTDEDTLDMFA